MYSPSLVFCSNRAERIILFCSNQSVWNRSLIVLLWILCYFLTCTIYSAYSAYTPYTWYSAYTSKSHDFSEIRLYNKNFATLCVLLFMQLLIYQMFNTTLYCLDTLSVNFTLDCMILLRSGVFQIHRFENFNQSMIKEQINETWIIYVVYQSIHLVE